MRDETDPIRVWLKKTKSIDLGDRQIIDPQRTGQPIGEIVSEAGGGQVFDTEPARFYRLIQDLAPKRASS
jgi:hypothetical protein